ncbi:MULTISPECIES: hypothetical protein [unclassified Rhodococcus (in: high G+C Gram-positive bacteria)]|uniref:hypothetical protein n=1 Tax=unclassified Rhodococcus (in: high G+C Gram-positive bacteria) TaxID=192944 RepID=UPI00117B6ECA|nr:MULTISPECIES: hypothetical protein [unclassified Rhodococcus (in: high G+C Gram-positive bacteria)]
MSIMVTAVVVAGFFVVFGHFAGVPRTQTVATIVVVLVSAVPTLWIDETTSFAVAFGIFVSTGVLASLALGGMWFLARYVRGRRDSRLSNSGGELGGVVS